MLAIARPPSLVDEVCQRLAGLTRRDHLGDDGWLPTERDLAAQLCVSRSVVREATKRLEQQGLLEIRQGLGIRAVDRLHKPLNGSVRLLIPQAPRRLRQLTEVRLLIEPELARLAAQRGTAAQLRAIRRAHERMISATTDQEGIAADLEFHRQIAAAAGNEICSLLLDSVAELGIESRHATIGTVGVEVAIEHHAAILVAIERRQPGPACECMKRHLETATADLLASQKKSVRRR